MSLFILYVVVGKISYKILNFLVLFVIFVSQIGAVHKLLHPCWGRGVSKKMTLYDTWGVGGSDKNDRFGGGGVHIYIKLKDNTWFF